MSQDQVLTRTYGQRVMPAKIHHIELNGEFTGWEFSAKSIKVNQYQTFAEEQKNEVGLTATIRLLDKIIIDWNFVDEEGKALPLGENSIGELPIELLNDMSRKYFEKANPSKE